MNPHSTLQSTLCAAALCFIALAPLLANAQEMVPPGGVLVVNMIDPAQSAETNRDSEPNLAVNPANPMHIAASAFTPDPDPSRGHAPIYVSVDGGRNWRLNPIIPFNHSETGTGDITLRFGTTSNVLYAAALKKPENCPSCSRSLSILRSRDFTGANLMEEFSNANHGVVDQPWIQAITTASGTGSNMDRVYIAYSDLECGCMRSPTVERSNFDPASVASSVQFATRPLSDRNGDANCTAIPTRQVVHDDGTVYAAFFVMTGGCGALRTAHLVVVRHNNWAEGQLWETFSDINDPDDHEPGRIVALGIQIPWSVNSSPVRLAQQRITGHISIAVDPLYSNRVFVAWGQGSSANDYRLHVRGSDDRGETWPYEWNSVEPAINPALAINAKGTVGLLYQALVDDNQWETRLLRSTDNIATSSNDEIVLQRSPLPDADAEIPTSDSNALDKGGGPLGDYNYLMAVDANFYGVFSANNKPDMNSFPSGVSTYRRGADFATNTLHAPDGSVVEPSIDPFFFVAPDPIRINVCTSQPSRCAFNPKMGRGYIRLKCHIRGCIVVDRFAENCLRKFACPGCSRRGMCPPYYHLHLDGMNNHWRVGLFDTKGSPIPHRQFRTAKGVVLSFLPNERNYTNGRFRSYLLAFELAPGGRVGFDYDVRTRLVRSDEYFFPGGVRSADRR